MAFDGRIMAATACLVLLCFLMTAHAGGVVSRPTRKTHHVWARALGGRQNQHYKAAAVVAGGDVVSQVCSNVSRDKPHIIQESCLSELRSDKRSADAKNTQDLTLLAIDLVKQSAAAADAKIAALLKGGKGGVNKDVERSLGFCRLNYYVIERLVPECRAIAALYPAAGDSGGNSTRDYWGCVWRLMASAKECNQELSMMWYNQPSFYYMETELDAAEDVLFRAILASAINDEMLGSSPDDDEDDYHGNVGKTKSLSPRRYYSSSLIKFD